MPTMEAWRQELDHIWVKRKEKGGHLAFSCPTFHSAWNSRLWGWSCPHLRHIFYPALKFSHKCMPKVGFNLPAMSHNALVVLKSSLEARTLPQSSSLSLLGVGIVGVHHHT